MKQWEQTEATLQGEINKDGLDEFERKLVDIQTEAEKSKKKLDELVEALNKAGRGKEAQGISLTGTAKIDQATTSKTDNAVTEQAKKDFDELLRIEKDIEEVQNRRFSSQAKLYESLGDLSEKSLQAQIKQIESRYQEDAKYVKDRVLLEKAMNNEIFKLRNDAEKRLIDMQLSYLTDLGEEFTAKYKELREAEIRNKADLLEQQFKNANGDGYLKEMVKQVEAEHNLTNQLLEEYQIRLKNYATYLMGMGDKEGADNALKAAKDLSDRQVELQNRVVDNKLKGLQLIFDKEKWINKQIGNLEHDLFQKKAGYIAQGFGELSSAFEGISKLYAEGSSDANRWMEAAKAMEIAQRSVAVVQAVAAIATQGLGDPYTAFARVAAMAATMGALLATIGESVNGGGGGSSSTTAHATGNSTVLGAAYGTQSESIANSLEILTRPVMLSLRERIS
jgi:hypothetical protein